MNQEDQTNAFHQDLINLVERYQQGFELTFASAIGVLEIVKLDLWLNERDSVNAGDR